MGFRFRKSKSFGPFRINISKSGIGWSVGAKGVRYTHRADGKKQTTFSIPGTGISYVDVKGKSKANKNNVQNINLNNFSNKNNDYKLPFYKRKWFMWLMFFIIPPIGIILMWLYSGYKIIPKIILSIFFGIISISVYGRNEQGSSANLTNKESRQVESNNVTETVQEKTETTSYIKETPKLTGWQNIGGKYYYYDENGNTKSGWIQDNDKYYYCDNSGVMKTGWIQDSGKWYYLNNNGTMATSTTIDGYYVNSDGVMQEKTPIDTSKSTTKSSSSSQNSSSNQNTNSFENAKTDVTTNDPAPTGRTVYWTPGGKSYHYNRNCPTLKRSKTVLSGTSSECPKNDPCNVCVK